MPHTTVWIKQDRYEFAKKNNLCFSRMLRDQIDSIAEGMGVKFEEKKLPDG